MLRKRIQKKKAWIQQKTITIQSILHTFHFNIYSNHGRHNFPLVFDPGQKIYADFTLSNDVLLEIVTINATIELKLIKKLYCANYAWIVMCVLWFSKIFRCFSIVINFYDFLHLHLCLIELIMYKSDLYVFFVVGENW